jgi:hypothetical protein
MNAAGAPLNSGLQDFSSLTHFKSKTANLNRHHLELGGKMTLPIKKEWIARSSTPHARTA